MTGKTHAVLAANTLWLAVPLGLRLSVLAIPLAMLAGLLPDLDASESTVKHLSMPIFGLRVKPFFLPAFLVHHLFRHRGWLHSAVAIVVVGVASWLGFGRFGLIYPVACTLGYASHIIADGCTKSGVQFLLPIPTPTHFLPKALRLTTGGYIEQLLFIAAVFGLVFFVKWIVPV